VGETLEERERGETKDVITRQVEKGLEGISDLSLATIAYEPVWAIGTGAAASCADAASAHKIIHKLADVKVLYGGSVTDENAPILLKEKEIDGLLIGSASLNSQNFAKIFSLKEG
jgi:triosephosphate isomerase